MANWSDFSILDIEGKPLDLQALQGKVVLWVNTASQCGFTPQLTGLQELHQRYASQGLVVIGSPCNQFGSQDPDPESQIHQFCQKNHGVTFNLTQKVNVNGQHAHPIFQWLKTQAPGLLGSKTIKWNFTKFLIGRDGQPKRRYASTDTPLRLVPDIEAELAL